MIWHEVGDRCFQRRYESFDLNIGVILGNRGALVIDTRASLAEAAELADDLRVLGVDEPRWVVNTHAHFDHYLGNRRFAAAQLWGHATVPAAIASNDLTRTAEVFPDWGAATKGEDLTPVPPTHLVESRAEIDVGGRTVELRHPGPGHTEGDLVVWVPDAAVLYAGDLVEQGAPPAYGSDSFPLDWPGTVSELLTVPASVVVPGHGTAVDPSFVAGQRDELSSVARLIRESYDEGLDDPAVLTDAVSRAYAKLASVNGQ